jgi:multiple sugar transport system permease protein
MTVSRQFPWRFVVSLIAAVVLCAPLYWMVVTAMQPQESLLTTSPSILPAALSFSGFTTVIADNPVWAWLRTSFFVTIGTTAISIVVSTLAGYSLSRFRNRGHQVMGMALLLSRMLPGSLLVIPFYSIFLNIGLVNNVFSVVFVNCVFVIPFATWLLKGFFDGIPRELEEACFVDGGGRLLALVRIILPLSRPGILAAATYSAIFAWGDFLFARTLLTSDTNWPVTVGIVSFIGDNGTNWNAIMAMGLIAVAPMAVVFIASERFLTSGLTAGGVKG